MKSIVSWFAAVLLLALTLFSTRSLSAVPVAQDDPPLEEIQQPFLWEIRGEKTSYLFGTIHIPDKRITKLHPTISAALEASDSLYVETAPRDMMKQMKAMTLARGEKLTDLVPAEMLERLDKQLNEINPALSHKTLGQFAVWAWPLLLPSLEVQMKDPTAPVLDMQLVNLAQQAGKSVEGLENPDDQCAGLKALTLEEQLAFLDDSLKSMEEADENDEDMLKELSHLYLTGDADKLHTYFEQEMRDGDLPQALIDKILKALLTDRNQRMAETIVKALEESPDKSFFFAAGTAHFLGDQSIQSILKQKGIEVVRVKFPEAAAESDSSGQSVKSEDGRHPNAA